jgi:hypothetical protein
MKGMHAVVLLAMIAPGTVAWGQTPALVAAGQSSMSEKQKQLLEQTNLLLKMAAELKVSVDKSTKDQLSLDVVRKAEAVEKMAKEMKGKMR